MKIVIAYLEEKIEEFEKQLKRAKRLDYKKPHINFLEKKLKEFKIAKQLSERTNTNETSGKHETEQLNILDVSNSLSDLNGKTLTVKFKVTKYKPKIVLNIDLANDC